MSKWEWKKLGDLYPIVMGKTPPRGDSSYWDKEKKTNNIWVSIADISANENSIIRDSKEYISNKAAKNIKLVASDSLLVSFKLTIGKMAFAGVPLYTNEAIISLPPRKDISLEYLHKYFLYFDWDKACSGDVKVKGKTLNKEKLKNIDVLLPPLSEQKRIVKFLDEEFSKIETLKTNAETNLRNARQLFKAGLEKTFQGKNFWKKMLLEDVCSNIVDCPHTTPKKVSYQTNYPCIRTSELKCGEIDWKSMQYLDEKEYKKRIARLEPKENDIVYGREGTFGDAVLLPNTHHFSLGQRTMLFRPDLNFVIPRFLLLSIISPYVYKQAQEKNNGCGVGHVNVGDIKKFNVFIPPLSVQKEIVARLDKLSENVKCLEANYKQIIANCDELKKSILKKTFEEKS